MSINYYVKPYNLNGHGGFNARIVRKDTYDSIKVIRHMIQQGSTSTESDIKAVMTDMIKTIKYLVSNGVNVQIDGLGTISSSIKGNFETIEDTFDTSRHELKLNISPVKALINDVLNSSELLKIEINDRTPAIRTIVDLGTGTEDQTITAGDEVIIKGNRMLFDPAMDDEGIFLVADDGREHKFNYCDKPAAIRMKFVMNAPFEPGTICHFEIRSRLGTKTVRTGKSKAGVTIA